MSLWIFQIYAKMPGGSLKTGAILAENRPAALEKAVKRVKPIGGRVKFITPVLDVSDVKRLRSTSLIEALEGLDQLSLVSFHLRWIIDKQIKVVSDLRDIIKTKMENS